MTSPLLQLFDDTHLALYRRSRAAGDDDAAAEAAMRAAYRRAARGDELPEVDDTGDGPEPPAALVERLRSELEALERPAARQRIAAWQALQPKAGWGVSVVVAFAVGLGVGGPLGLVRASSELEPTPLTIEAPALGVGRGGAYTFQWQPGTQPELVLLQFTTDNPIVTVNGRAFETRGVDELVVPRDLLTPGANHVVFGPRAVVNLGLTRWGRRGEPREWGASASTLLKRGDAAALEGRVADAWHDYRLAWLSDSLAGLDDAATAERRMRAQHAVLDAKCTQLLVEEAQLYQLGQIDHALRTHSHIVQEMPKEHACAVFDDQLRQLYSR